MIEEEKITYTLLKYYGIYQFISGDEIFSSPEPKFDSIDICHNQASLSDATNSEKNVVQMRKKE